MNQSFLLLFLIWFGLVSCRETISVSAGSTIAVASNPVRPFTLSDDLLIFRTIQGFQLYPRTADGTYQFNSSISVSGIQPIANRKWFGVISSGLFLGQFFNGYQLQNQFTLPCCIKAARLYDDDTVVVYSSTSFSMSTYKVNATSNWEKVAETAISTSNNFRPAEYHPFRYDPTDYYPSTAFRGNYFFGYRVEGSNCTLEVRERQPATFSWRLIAAIRIACGYTGSSHVTYNGIDLIAVSNYNEILVFMNDQQAGQWTQLQRILSSDTDYQLYGDIPDFGVGLSFIDPYTLVAGAPASNSAGGAVIVLYRNASGLFEPVYDIVADQPVKLGIGIAVNSRDVVMLGYSATDHIVSVYQLPIEQVQKCGGPIDVTCLTLQLDDCSDISFESLYTINDPCPATKLSKYLGIGYAEDKITVRFAFSKLSRTATCNATVICPASQPPQSPPLQAPVPTVVPQSDCATPTPISLPSPITSPIDSPLGSPLSTESPVTIFSPDAAPETAPSDNTPLISANPTPVDVSPSSLPIDPPVSSVSPFDSPPIPIAQPSSTSPLTSPVPLTEPLGTINPISAPASPLPKESPIASTVPVTIPPTSVDPGRTPESNSVSAANMMSASAPIPIVILFLM